MRLSTVLTQFSSSSASRGLRIRPGQAALITPIDFLFCLPFSALLRPSSTSPHSSFRLGSSATCSHFTLPLMRTHHVSPQLFLPAVGVFSLTYTVPFHVQLTGAVPSLCEFLPSDGSGRKVTIVGSLVRQVIVDLNSCTAASSVDVAHAATSPRLPVVATPIRTEMKTRQVSMGTLVGTFDAGCVRVQDFILIEVKPRNAETRSDYGSPRLSHPIRLVTESWVHNSLSRDGPRLDAIECITHPIKKTRRFLGEIDIFRGLRGAASLVLSMLLCRSALERRHGLDGCFTNGPMAITACARRRMTCRMNLKNYSVNGSMVKFSRLCKHIVHDGLQ
ncbi:hypothetical protein K438DRAFT_804194 [Mycena galopus ATCC 62051]|nr:hypothetical protein K438DRAFT_804194 [Mycena galopus ATCC 62051]